MAFFVSKKLLKYVVSISILAFIMSKMDFGALWDRSQDVSLFAILISLFMMVLQILFLNLRWHALMNGARARVSFANASLINVAGCFANILFIASIGGIVAKSGLAIRHGLSVTQSVFITLLDRFMTLAALLVFSALSLPFLRNILDEKLSFLLCVAVLLIVLSCILFVATLRSGVLSEYLMSSRRKSRFLAILRTYMENYNLMSKAVLYSLLGQGVFFVGVYVLSYGVHDDSGQGVWSVVSFFALMPVLALIASLPISFGGWGVREGAFVYGLGLIGYSWEAAFLISVQVGIVTMIAPFIVGLPYFLKQDMRRFFLNPAVEE